MKLRVNGDIVETQSATLDELCRALGYPAEVKIATAVNGEFVAAAARGATELKEADEVEIVSPRQGG